MKTKIGMAKVGEIRRNADTGKIEYWCTRDARKFQIYYKKSRFTTLGGYPFDCKNAIGFETYKVKQMFAKGVSDIVVIVKGHAGTKVRVVRILARDLPTFGEKIKEEGYGEQYVISLDRYW